MRSITVLRTKIEKLTREPAAARKPDGTMVFTAPGWDAAVLERARRTEQAEAKLAAVVEALHVIEYMPCLRSEPTALLMRKIAAEAALAAAREQQWQQDQDACEAAEREQLTQEKE
jgi:hypothetical protein